MAKNTTTGRTQKYKKVSVTQSYVSIHPWRKKRNTQRSTTREKEETDQVRSDQEDGSGLDERIG